VQEVSTCSFAGIIDKVLEMRRNDYSRWVLMFDLGGNVKMKVS
jgi:hypothetical protein